MFKICLIFSIFLLLLLTGCTSVHTTQINAYDGPVLPENETTSVTYYFFHPNEFIWIDGVAHAYKGEDKHIKVFMKPGQHLINFHITAKHLGYVKGSCDVNLQAGYHYILHAEEKKTGGFWSEDKIGIAYLIDRVKGDELPCRVQWFSKYFRL